jgi:hypothetical protein
MPPHSSIKDSESLIVISYVAMAEAPTFWSPPPVYLAGANVKKLRGKKEKST